MDRPEDPSRQRMRRAIAEAVRMVSSRRRRRMPPGGGTAAGEPAPVPRGPFPIAGAGGVAAELAD